METTDMIKVMQHYADGGEIEVRFKDEDNDIWENIDKPSWDWVVYDYRIVEQKQKVTIEKWLCKSGENSFYIHEGTDADGLEKVKLLETYEVEL